MIIQSAGITGRLLARLFGASLDRRLATGSTPESGHLLAIRAQQLVALRSRRELARRWEHLLAVAARQPRAGTANLLCRDRILAARDDVRDLAARLRSPLPVPAAGVAAAQVLLTDATGPVYNPRYPGSLTARLHRIAAELDPGQPLQSLVRSNT
jgi:hypothetical protein